MNTQTYVIFLPCEVLEVRYVAMSARNLTPIERFIIEAIHVGVDDFHGLVHLFGLGERPMLDLLLDLWNRSYLQIDVSAGRISLPGDIAKRAAEDQARREGRAIDNDSGGLGALAGVRRPEKIELLRERVSGHVLASVPLVDRPTRARVAPAQLPLGAPLDSDRSEILTVVRECLRRKEANLDGEIVEEVYLPADATADADAPLVTRLLRVDVDARIDAGDDLILDVCAAWYLRAAVRRDLSARLQQAAEASPDLIFFRQLRAHARRVELGGRSEPEELLADLEQQLERLTHRHDLSADRLIEAHEGLVASADEIADLLQQRWFGEGAVGVLSPSQQDHWLMEVLARRAKRQVVIAGPAPRYAWLSQALPAIESALRRGVQVVLIWGARGAEVLEGPVRTALDDLAFRHPGQLRHDDVPARSNARFVVFDDVEILLGSRDPSSRVEAGIFAPMVHFRPTRTGDLGPIAEVLAWARMHFPDFVAGRRILTAGDFLDPRTPVPRLSLPNVPELPPAARAQQPEGTEQRTVPAAAAALWREDWERHVRAVGSLVHANRTSVELVEDGAHRSWLTRLLAGARRLLVIVSPDLGRDVVDVHFLRSLTARMTAEPRLAVWICVGRVRDMDLWAELTALARPWGSRLRLERRPCDAALVLNEQAALVASFPFLSAYGYYLPSTRRRLRNELGFVVRGPAGVEAVLQEVRRWLPALDAAPEPVLAPAQTPDVPCSVPVSTRLQGLVAGLLAGEKAGDVVQCWLDTIALDHDVWADLSQVVSLPPGDSGGISRASLHRLAAAILLRRGTDPQDRRAAGWRAWLAAEMWAGGQLVPAWVLRSGSADTPTVAARSELPSPALALLGACLDEPDRLDLELESGESLVPSGEIQSLRLICVEGVLRHGSAAAGAVLESAVAPDALVAGARDYWMATGDAVPWRTLQAFAASDSARAQAATARLTLLHRLAQANNTGFTFKLGQFAWEHLLRNGGEVNRLGEAAAADDWVGAKSILNALPSRHGAAERLLDDATEAVLHRSMRGREREIVGAKRRACLDRLTDVLDATRDWVVAAEAALDRAASRRRVDSLRALAAVVKGELPTLTVTHERAAAAGRVDAPLLRRVLLLIGPLATL